MKISEQNLTERLGQLPRRIDPPRDLWPGVERQIARRRAGWRWESVAAGLMLAIGAFTVLWVGTGLESDEIAQTESTTEFPGVGIIYARSVDRQYTGALEDLADEMPRPPASVAEFGELQLELRRLERATEEIRAALEQDPEALYLAQLLETTHRKRISMLRELALSGNSLDGPRRT